MPRNITLTAALTAACLLGGIAQALACATGPLDQAAYDSSALIFEGSVIRTNDKQTDELTGEVKTRTYLFNIDRIWKGPAMMRNANIERDVAWGSAFMKNTPYLIVAGRSGGAYVADPCGYSAELAAAGPQLDFLNNQATLSIEE